MKKRFKLLLSKKGLTLVEILVVLIVSSILIGIAMGMLMPVKNLMNSIKGNAHMDTMCNTTNEYIRGSLQNATNIKIITYDKTDSESMNRIVEQVNSYKATKKSDDGYPLQVKALAILENSDNFYRLYDFEEITDDKNIKLLVEGVSDSSSDSENKYGVFRDSYYENTSYIMTVTNDKSSTPIVVKDSEGNVKETYTTTGWLKVTGQCFKMNEDDKTIGEPTNQPKTLSFAIYGNKVRFGGNDSDEAVFDSATNEFDTSKLKNGFVILYVTKKI